jgi:hypothetical protein
MDVFVAIETTGIAPDAAVGFVPKIVAFGAAAHRDGRLVSAGYLIRQPEVDLRHYKAAGAWRVNGLSPEVVLRDGRDEEQTARSFRAGMLNNAPRVYGYNVDFLRRFLSLPPWSLIGCWEPCLMERASVVVREEERARGVSGGFRQGKAKFVSLPSALAWAQMHGFDVDVPSDGVVPVQTKAIQVMQLAEALAEYHGTTRPDTGVRL